MFTPDGMHPAGCVRMTNDQRTVMKRRRANNRDRDKKGLAETAKPSLVRSSVGALRTTL